METRLRLVTISGAALIVALLLFVLLTLNSLPRTTHASALIQPIVVTSPEGSCTAPDLTK